MTPLKPRSSSLARLASTTLILAAAVALSGCTRFANYAASRADKAAYGIIEQKEYEALGDALPFTLDHSGDAVTSHLLTNTGWVNRESDRLTTPTFYVSLSDALAIAIHNNRDFQTRRENLYKAALSLTETRQNFGDYNLTGSLHGEWTHDVSGHGTAAGANTVDSGYLTQAIGFAVHKTLATGAEVTLDYAHAFTRYFSSATADAGTNGLAFAVVQPLLRNFGALGSLETLTQAERNMVYEVRDFSRDRKDFIIDIVDSYYSLLQQRDSLANQYNDYLSAKANRERAEAWASENRLAPIEADQARQRELSSQSSYIQALASYLTTLDRFKRQLGLPIDLDFAPDPVELHRLFVMSEGGLPELQMTPRQAIDLALTRRLDLITVEDQVDDKWRKLRKAFRRFLPTLEAFFEYSTDEDHGDPSLGLDFKDHAVTGGFDFVLPTDWTGTRNDYRRAMITYDQARRALDDKRDSVALEVLSAWRNLESARRSYAIQRQSVALAERRVERATILQEEGRGTQRDLLEAQDDLLSARNSLTSSVVSYTIQRLNFWQAVEGLHVNEHGAWQTEDETRKTTENEQASPETKTGGAGEEMQ